MIEPSLFLIFQGLNGSFGKLHVIRALLHCAIQLYNMLYCKPRALETPGGRGTPGDGRQGSEVPRICSKHIMDHLLLFSVLLSQRRAVFEPNEPIRGRSLCEILYI